MELDEWNEIRPFLPSGWLAMAQETQATKGLRQDKDPERLLRTMLLHLGAGLSLRSTAAAAQLSGWASLSDVAMLKRLRKCGGWFQRLCVALCQERGWALAATAKRPVRVVDSTLVMEPGQTGSQWRVHYSLQLPSLGCDRVEVTPVRGKGHGERLARYPLTPGEVVLADRGYCTAAGLCHVVAQGAFPCVRVNYQALPLFTATGAPFDLLAHLATVPQAGSVAEWPVCVQGPGGQTITGRLCVRRKDGPDSHRGKQRVRRRAQRRQRGVRPATLQVAEYILIFTTLPADEYSPAQVLDLYRLRWQIELVFKRFKQLAQLGHLPKRNPASAQAWVYGKLFLALLSEKLLAHARAISPWRDPNVPPGWPTQSMA